MPFVEFTHNVEKLSWLAENPQEFSTSRNFLIYVVLLIFKGACTEYVNEYTLTIFVATNFSLLLSLLIHNYITCKHYIIKYNLNYWPNIKVLLHSPGLRLYKGIKLLTTKFLKHLKLQKIDSQNNF